MEKSIRIGILFSLTGTMEISERGQYHAALLAIEQINQNGGINGRKIRPFVSDSASNPYIAAKEAEKLIVEHKVVAILGLYTSASRKLIIPILEKYNSVLFYPTQYEGEEQHPNIVYCGPLPSQNLIHFIPWIIDNIGKRFYLIGSDYIYPLEMNSQIKLLVTINKGKILGENYEPLGEQKFEGMIQGIRKLNPDIVFSTLVGNSAVSFYKQYYEAGLTKPIASLITAETEIAAINPEYTIGHYACFPYFDSIDTKENKLFLNAFKSLYNTNVVSSAMENAYNGIFLLAEALKKCETIDTPSILINIKGVRFQAPQGEIMVDNTNQHVWLNSRIGQVNENGKFNILWESNNKIQPIPFAKYYFSNRENRDKTLNQLEEELQSKLK
jgi:ABC-type branched-subunit amino acid transport system substrate-binding protein